ncbi:MAG: hypothetical protein M1136_07570 [Chloroflexi bacterium]|nr:hypothetical protein [Chloroflexota bacterium]MCL5075493.1 hypothetical protein [Chloroflexota bacterium]
MPTREEMHSLAQEIIGSYEARVEGIASLREEVTAQRRAAQALLHELDRAHQAMARQQRADLARGRADLTKNEARRKPAVGAWMREVAADHQAMARRQRAELARGRADLTKTEARRKSAVGAWMKEVAADHQAMARRQRTELARGRADLTKTEAQRKSRVDAWMREVAAAHTEAREEWQKLTATMCSKRGAAVVEMKPPKPAVEVTPEFASLRDRVFEYLASHPDGTRLAELEQEFGLPRIQMARVVKVLMDENKVEKRDLLYFAI